MSDDKLVSLAEKAPWRLHDLDDLIEGLMNMGYEGVLVDRAQGRPGMWACRVLGRTEGRCTCGGRNSITEEPGHAGWCPAVNGEIQRVTQIAPTIREAVYRVGQRIGRHFAPDVAGAAEETHQGDDAPTSDEIIDHLVGRVVDMERTLEARAGDVFMLNRELEELRPKGGLWNAVRSFWREMRPRIWAKRDWSG